MDIDLIIYKTSESVHTFYHHIENLTLFLFIILFELYSKYIKDFAQMQAFLNENRTKLNDEKISQLLSLLIPDFVKECFIENKNFEDQGAVAILFCEICNFDEILQNEKKNVVSMLDEIYRVFDTYCAENHVKKIEVKNFLPVIFAIII